jgi:hypothetical protein
VPLPLFYVHTRGAEIQYLEMMMTLRKERKEPRKHLMSPQPQLFRPFPDPVKIRASLFCAHHFYPLSQHFFFNIILLLLLVFIILNTSLVHILLTVGFIPNVVMKKERNCFNKIAFITNEILQMNLDDCGTFVLLNSLAIMMIFEINIFYR